MKMKRALECPTPSTASSKRQKTEADLVALSLPAHLARPPTHAQHAPGLQLSLAALRNLLSSSTPLAAEAEARAYVELSELSIQLVPLLADDDEEIDRSLSKVLALASKRSESGRAMRCHAVLLQASMAAARGQAKFAHKLLSTLLAGFGAKDPPALVYTTRLAKIQLHLSAPSESRAALESVRELRAEADANGSGHAAVALLSCVLTAAIVVTRGLWHDAESAVRDAEQALGLSYPDSPRPGDVRRTSSGNTARSTDNQAETFVMFEDAFELTCAAHVLVYSVVFLTHIGDSAGAGHRLSHLHALLDEGALAAFPDGVATIPLPTGPPLCVRTTPPRILFALGYLVSASAKRDPVGRKPKRATFAQAGLDNLDEKEGPAFEFPVWNTVGDVDDAAYAMIRIRADLLSEMAGVSIHRNDFAKADEMLDKLIALTRTHGLWDRYAPRVTLHHAHLAHARLDHERALVCYDTAAHLGARDGAGAEDNFVNLAARAGAVLLRVGLLPPDDEGEATVTGEEGRGEMVANEEDVEEEREVEEVVVPKKGKGRPRKRKAPARRKAKTSQADDDATSTSASTSTLPALTTSTLNPATWTRAQILDEAECVYKACMGQGSALEMAGAVVKAVVSSEILRSKAHLRRALALATSSGANHTRAALLALGAAHYARTDPPHALDALRGADVLAAGLGAAPKPDASQDVGNGNGSGLGNVALRLWCGERKVELLRRAGPGEAERVGRQEERNRVFRSEVEAIRGRVK